jgi:hypothetical protein
MDGGFGGRYFARWEKRVKEGGRFRKVELVVWRGQVGRGWQGHDAPAGRLAEFSESVPGRSTTTRLTSVT